MYAARSSVIFLRSFFRIQHKYTERVFRRIPNSIRDTNIFCDQ